MRRNPGNSVFIPIPIGISIKDILQENETQLKKGNQT